LESKLPSSLTTLAEFLSDLGYNTVGMSSNPWLSSQFGITRGFDEFHHLSVPFGGDSYREFATIITDRSRSVPDRIRKLLLTQNVPTLFKNGLNAAYRQVVEKPDDGASYAVKHAKNVLKGERPYFLFINFLEPHLPYEPPDSYKMRFMPDSISNSQVTEVNQNARDYNIRNIDMTDQDFDILERLYDAEINYVDDQIGRLLNIIDTRGDSKETMVIVLSDHGENIGDHGLMSHNYSVHETLLHVPLIFRYPDVFEGGERIKTRVSSLDIPATIESLLDYKGEETFHSQQVGTSLTETDADRTNVAEYLNPVPPIERMKARCQNPDFDISVYDRTFRAVYDGQFKFIQDSYERRELYDVESDQQEQNNLVEQKPGVTDELVCELRSWIEKYGRVTDPQSASTDVDEQIEDRLQELGYL
jgi:arylsulfatase A-like enzyme